jgi:hypothetical protein
VALRSSSSAKSSRALSPIADALNRNNASGFVLRVTSRYGVVKVYGIEGTLADLQSIQERAECAPAPNAGERIHRKSVSRSRRDSRSERVRERTSVCRHTISIETRTTLAATDLRCVRVQLPLQALQRSPRWPATSRRYRVHAGHLQRFGAAAEPRSTSGRPLLKSRRNTESTKIDKEHKRAKILFSVILWCFPFVLFVLRPDLSDRYLAGVKADKRLCVRSMSASVYSALPARMRRMSATKSSGGTAGLQ